MPLSGRQRLQLAQEFLRIGFRVVTVGEGIACRVNARCAAEGRHFQSGVVGKTVETITLKHVAGLDEGVASSVSAVSGMSSWQLMSAKLKMRNFWPTMLRISCSLWALLVAKTNSFIIQMGRTRKDRERQMVYATLLPDSTSV